MGHSDKAGPVVQDAATIADLIVMSANDYRASPRSFLYDDQILRSILFDDRNVRVRRSHVAEQLFYCRQSFRILTWCKLEVAFNVIFGRYLWSRGLRESISEDDE